MSCCLYLPGGKVAFIFKRAEITSNDAMNAGGMSIDEDGTHRIWFDWDLPSE
jgi:hypothetical protein